MIGETVDGRVVLELREVRATWMRYRAFGRGDRLVDPGSPARYSAELPCFSSCAHFKSAPSPRPRPLARY
jgi:hypothetical protein